MKTTFFSLIALLGAIMTFNFSCDPACADGGCGDDDADNNTVQLSISVESDVDSGNVSVFVDDSLVGPAPATAEVAMGTHYAEAVDNTGFWYYASLPEAELNEDTSFTLKGGVDLTGDWVDIELFRTETASMRSVELDGEIVVKVGGVGPFNAFYIEGRAIWFITSTRDTLEGEVNQAGTVITMHVTYENGGWEDIEYHKI
ncbi:TPA: hypothetical protein DCZ32_01625 [Candidatus Uhrbacteria bacterium]|nr:hypothetical protein [Candidatus Uhrbacteria bacterium]